MIRVMNWANTLINDCLDEIDRKYGSTSSHYLPYHNAEHARDVMDAAGRIGKRLNFDSKTIELLELGACFHDIEHGLGRGEDEAESATTVHKRMIEIGYSEEEADRVKGMILATIVKVTNGKIIQSATDDKLTQIIADADLANFGRPFKIFWNRTMKLRKEHGNIEPLIGQDKYEYIKSQISMLEKHAFYTDAAKQLFPHKERNIAELKNMLKRV